MMVMIKYFFIGFVAVSYPLVIGSPVPTCQTDTIDFHRDATNCSRYYECNRGHVITLECPSGMYFNEQIPACDFSEYVDCDPVCPYPSDGVNLFYDPKNCSRYYECNRGTRVLLTCPATIPLWNHIGQFCDFEEYVDCSRGGSSTPSTIITPTTSATPGTTATPITTVTPTTSVTSRTTDVTSTPDSTCSSYLAEEKIFLVYPPDCSKYYLCYNGVGTVESCPEGLLFNDATLQCDFIDNVSCAQATHLPYSTTSSSETTITTSGTTSVTRTTGVTSPPDPTCSSYPADEKIYLLYPADCSKYYLCYNGAGTVETCPEGLLFNDVTLLCDFIDNVSCDHASTYLPYSTTSSVLTTITTPMTSASSGTTGVTSSPDPTCSSYSAGEKIYIVYPADCSKYFLCYNGAKSVETCPEGLLFNDVTLQCDFIDNVDCAHASSHLPYPTTSSGQTTIITSPTKATTTVTPTGPTKTTTVTSTTPTGDMTICKDKPSGTMLIDPDNCACYFECSNGIAYHFTCPLGTLWDENLKDCNNADDVIC